MASAEPEPVLAPAPGVVVEGGVILGSEATDRCSTTIRRGPHSEWRRTPPLTRAAWPRSAECGLTALPDLTTPHVHHQGNVIPDGPVLDDRSVSQSPDVHYPGVAPSQLPW
jgi:hypothetical protein